MRFWHKKKTVEREEVREDRMSIEFVTVPNMPAPVVIVTPKNSADEEELEQLLDSLPDSFAGYPNVIISKNKIDVSFLSAGSTPTGDD
mgnify:CR=1 FL=1